MGRISSGHPAQLTIRALSGYISIFVGILGSLTASQADILYVSTSLGNIIEQFDLATGADLGAFAHMNVYGLAIDKAGNLYAGNDILSSLKIAKFTPSGVFSPFATNGVLYSTGLAFDPAGNLYAADLANNIIAKFTPDGKSSVFAQTNLNYPYGLAFDAAGNLYVANWGNSTVVRFATNGASALVANTDEPYGLAFDKNGNLFVSNAGTGTITKVTPTGDVSIWVENAGSDVRDIAFDSAGNLYVANFGNSTISKITPQGDVSAFAQAPGDLSFIAIQPTATPASLTNPKHLSDGSFQFEFTNTPGAAFTVMATTNLSLAPSNWAILTGVSETTPGQFQFADPQATNFQQRFYRVSAP